MGIFFYILDIKKIFLDIFFLILVIFIVKEILVLNCIHISVI